MFSKKKHKQIHAQRDKDRQRLFPFSSHLQVICFYFIVLDQIFYGNTNNFFKHTGFL